MEHRLANVNDIYDLIKNWAVLAYAETFAKQKREMAALAGGQAAQPEAANTEEDESKKKLAGSES